MQFGFSETFKKLAVHDYDNNISKQSAIGNNSSEYRNLDFTGKGYRMQNS